MKKEILDFIQSQRICVLAVEMLDGSPHAATLHFAHQDDPLIFFFETSPSYRKAEPLLKRGETRASVVVGFDENNMKTLQLDGTVKLIEEKDNELFNIVYLGKFPQKAGKIYNNSPEVLFSFTPTWWRFTDWTGPNGKVIVLSTDK